MSNKKATANITLSSTSDRPSDKVLVLAYTHEDVECSAPLITSLVQSGTKLTVLGLDFESWTELRKRKIPYKTPGEYLDTAQCDAIDKEALHFARTWYRPYSRDTTYHGISLGEMVEFNFVMYFIDSLRSIEIARQVIELESPTQIFLPQSVPPIPATAAGAAGIRYYTLVNAINYIAESLGIRVSYLRYGFNVLIRFGVIKKNVISLARRVVKRTYETILLFLTFVEITKHARRARKEFKSKDIAVFLDVGDEISLSIKRELESGGSCVVTGMSGHLMSLLGRYRKCNRGESWSKLSNSDFALDLAYKNVPLRVILAERFTHFFHSECVHLADCVDGVEWYIGRMHPSILVTMDDITPDDRLIAKLCRMNGISTLVIQNGITGADVGGFHVMPLEAHVQAVWGHFSQQWAVERGKSSETQIVTGFPKFDPIATRASGWNKRNLTACRKLGLTGNGGIVVLAPTWYSLVSSCYTPEEDEIFLRETIAAMQNFPEKQVVIKFHPSFWRQYERMALAITEELHSSNVTMTSNYLWELLGMCELLVTNTSAVAVEAILFDRPVITFIPSGRVNLNPYARTDSVIKVYRTKDLVQAIQDALYDAEVRGRLAIARKAFTYECTYIQDGKASQRVASLVLHMMARKSIDSSLEET